MAATGGQSALGATVVLGIVAQDNPAE